MFSPDEVNDESKDGDILNALINEEELELHVEQECLTPENFVLFASYLSAGFVLYFLGTPLSYYMISELNCSAGQQATVWTALGLPWGLKFLFGLLSDSVPLLGLRRKPYFLIGWTTFAKCNLILLLLRRPTLPALVVLLFTMTCGFVLADVCTDAMVVERSNKYGTHLQALGYSLRFLGGIFGAVMGAVSYSADFLDLSIAQIFLINMLVPIVTITPFFVLYGWIEAIPTPGSEPSFRGQLSILWEMVQKSAIYQPCAFIFLYSKRLFPFSQILPDLNHLTL